MFGPPVQSRLMAIDVSGFHQIASYESSIQTEKEYILVKANKGMKLSLNIEMHACSAILCPDKYRVPTELASNIKLNLIKQRPRKLPMSQSL